MELNIYPNPSDKKGSAAKKVGSLEVKQKTLMEMVVFHDDGTYDLPPGLNRKQKKRLRKKIKVRQIREQKRSEEQSALSKTGA